MCDVIDVREKRKIGMHLWRWHMSLSYWLPFKKYYSQIWLSWPKVKYLKKLQKNSLFSLPSWPAIPSSTRKKALQILSFHLVQINQNQLFPSISLHRNFASSVNKCIGEVCLKIKGVQYPSLSCFLVSEAWNTLLPLMMLILCLMGAWEKEYMICFLIWFVLVKFLFYWEFFWFNMILMLGACMMNCNGWKWL